MCAACGVRTAATPRARPVLPGDLDVGPAQAYKSITEMVRDPEIHAIWLCGPNQTRIENVEEITRRGRSWEGRVARDRVREAAGTNRGRSETGLRSGERAGIAHGYLENQLFAPGVVRGRELSWLRGARGAVGRTSPGQRKNTPARTTGGSGKEASRAVVSSTT